MGARVVVSQYVFPDVLAALSDAGYDVDGRTVDTPLPPEELRRAVADANALICLLTDRVDEELLSAAPRLVIVANVAVGFDNIDVGAATQRGVAVSNTPGVLTEASADLAFALILATARRVAEGDTFLRAGLYRHWKLAQEQLGVDVFGQSLGIIGLGKIGRALARRARAGFGMHVVYHSRNRLPDEQERELGVTYVDMESLLATSDFVSLHTPLTPETHHLIDAAALALMKPNAILINTSRGPVVDESALAAALAAGTIGGAGLDVYEDEPRVCPELLTARDRVVLLPHLGSATMSTRRKMSEIAVANVIDALGGARPRNLVNPDVDHRFVTSLPEML
jgi:lactate dehydrogenase-like 2-hydroxyacid dehydrogenase